LALDVPALFGMTTSNFRNLRCWQLADALRVEVIAMCARERVARDFKFCDNFLDAAGSVCHNISEGFARFESAEILRFFRYALASLAEVQDQLIESRERKFIEPAEFDRLWDQAEHTKATSLNFMKPHDAKVKSRKKRNHRPSARGT
jgi:four helix bundle protein